MARQKPGLFPVIGLARPTIYKEIAEISKGYDHVIIDGAPSVTDLARGCILASDVTLIPVTPSPLDVWAANFMVTLIEEASVFRPQLKAAFVINRLLVNTIIAREVIHALHQHPIPVFKSSISQRVIFAESMAQGMGVHEYAENSPVPAVSEIEDIVCDLMELTNEHQKSIYSQQTQ